MRLNFVAKKLRKGLQAVLMPVAVVGGQSAGIKGGRYVRHAQGTPIANLYVALLDTLGVHVETFGDSTGTVETLT